MAALYGLLTLCLAVTIHGMPNTLIVGGNDAAKGKYPYQVSLRTHGRHFCGGSVINKRFILTAAHCIFMQDTQTVQVIVGTNYLSETGDSYRAEKLIVHSGYTSLRTIHDIGLIRVDRDIKFYEQVQPIPLALAYYIPPGETAVVSGWGRLSSGSPTPDKLQEIYLTVISQTICKSVYWQVEETNICTYTQPGEGVCNGDSGGPLVANGIQVGIVSFGIACAVGRPDVYTRVYSYKSWIDNNIED